MMNVNIHKNLFVFRFGTDDGGIYLHEKECYYCGYGVSYFYSQIIDDLKDAGLLDKDYKYMCCYCAVLKKFGLLEWRRYVDGWDYNIKENYLTIHFGLNFDEKGDWVLRIWDYKKFYDR